LTGKYGTFYQKSSVEPRWFLSWCLNS